MVKDYSKNIAILVLLNVVTYLVHRYLMLPLVEIKDPLVLNIELAYAINAIVSISICVSMVALQKIFESQIGFIFLGLSVLKMILLYLLLNPTNEMGLVNKADAFTFFIPFGLNLVMELVFIVKLLKISDLAKELNKK